MPKQQASRGTGKVAVLTTWPVFIAVLCLVSSTLPHRAHGDSSSDSSSEENSSELMSNVHSLKDREHVLQNKTTKNRGCSGCNNGDTPNVLSSAGVHGGEFPTPSDALEDDLKPLIIMLKSGSPTEKKSAYYNAVFVQSAADPVLKNPEGAALHTGDAEVSFRDHRDGIIAVAHLIRYRANAAEGSGNIVFHQVNPLEAVRMHGTLELVADPASVKIEIHANADASNGCQNVGRIYNPFGVPDGGVILRSGATIEDDYVSFFKDDRNIFQLTLYGDSKVIGRSVVVYDERNVAVACGVILQTTT